MARVVICGFGGHGKSRVAEWLRDHHGLEFCESSWVCRYRVYNGAPSLHKYPNAETAWKNRHLDRPLWEHAIFRINTPVLTTVASMVFEDEGAGVYCGMRKLQELAAAREKWDDILAIWVDASQRLGATGDGTIGPDDCDIVLRNNGNWSRLERKLTRVFGLVPELVE